MPITATGTAYRYTVCGAPANPSTSLVRAAGSSIRPDHHAIVRFERHYRMII
ncbi:MAG: hypothetical protein JWO57_711, partial [Pseudonocardiales bacterium]|nr:hypothetical protein [Pseudonocardiales bacterium]